ncbi:FAD/NAD(P)-binding domain-containing protein [Pluteus cervinus]|uniref:FAD/NAD(P)-binding domain-containing protein n=1 Tax=Pluteus cervinus TaxID=181527 RepID=A0ACD3B0J9_9AGAR|nr:FAD/NAD(P)-binding domain-containing protein [Pluteus cervinus]
MSSVPSNVKVLVIGGGPAGSYAASVLAREDIDVLVIEADKFPRYHIGESQLASLRHFLRFIDLEKEFEAFGFQKKAGAGFKLNKHKREGFTDFITPDPNNYSWNVIRSISDELMLRHAERVGAKVVEETKITELEWTGEGDTARPVAASWKNKAGETGKVSFDFVIDASGRAGIISTKYLKNRDFNSYLKNVAIWGYWKGAGKYLPGTPRENSPLFEALADETGWNWFIPLHDGTVSVGVVGNQEVTNTKKAKLRENGGDSSLLAHYKNELKQTPNLLRLLEGAEMIKKPDALLVNSASDYSYQANQYAGPGFRIVGDAGAFIDPYFSSGVHLALAGSLNAAASICAEIRGEVSAEDAAKWHTSRTDSSYQRFLLVVLSAYQQIRHQAVDHLSGQNEDNFDRAFDFFRPIIQGHSDTGKRLAGDDLQKTVEFLGKHAFEPAQPEEPGRLVAKYGDPTKSLPVAKAGDTEEEIRQKNILKGVAIRKLIGTQDVYHLDNFVADTVQGYRLRLERGSLGLAKA